MIKAKQLILIIFISYIISFGQADDDTHIKISSALAQQLGLGDNQISDSTYTYAGTNAGGNFATQNDYFKIKRSVSPNYKDFFLKSKANFIEVEVQGCGRTFNDILIKESIDSDLGNFSDYNVFIDNPFTATHRMINEYKITNKNIEEDIGKLINGMNENYALKNNTIYVRIPQLNPGENIKYSYEIKSNKSGIFSFLTQVRLNGSIRQDLERLDQIEIRPPEIQVRTECDQSYAIRGKPLNITYCILHKSGWSKEPLFFNMRFNKTNDFEILYANGSPYNYKYINQTLYPLEETKFFVKVIYNEAGQYLVPKLDIEGATITQDNTNIDVIQSGFIKFLQDNIALVSISISLIAILITFFDYAISRRERDALIQITTKKDPSVYSGLRKDLIFEFYILFSIAAFWVIINIALSHSILSIICLPIILGIVFAMRLILIKNYKSRTPP